MTIAAPAKLGAPYSSLLLSGSRSSGRTADAAAELALLSGAESGCRSDGERFKLEAKIFLAANQGKKRYDFGTTGAQ